MADAQTTPGTDPMGATSPNQAQAPSDQQPAAGNPSTTSTEADTPAAATPNQAPQQGQPSQTPAPQGGSQPQQGSDDPNAPKTDLSKPQDGQQAPAAAAVHPQVAKAGILHDVAQALAGGPRYTTSIDPNTGVMSRTQVPVSGKQMAMAIAMEALGGGITGLTQTGPNHLANAAAAGFQQGEQQNTKMQQEQQEQASQDYARQAAITSTNFQTHANALKLGQMEYDSHKGYVADAKPILDNLTAAGAVSATGVHESDLMAKFHVTKDMAIADGVVPRMNPDGTQALNKDGSKAYDNTYSVIDPDKKIALPEESAKLLADHMIPGYFKMVDGKPQPIEMPANSQAAARIYVAGMAQAQSIDLTEQGVNAQLKGLKTDGDADAKEFAVDFKKALASGDMSQSATRVMSRYANIPLDQLRATMEKDKVDPDTIGQIMSVIPKDAVSQLTDAAAKKKSDAATAAKVAEQTALEPGKVKQTVDEARRLAPIKGQEAYTASANHEQAAIDVKKKNGIPITGGGAQSDAQENLTHPELADTLQDQANYNTPDGTNQKFLAGMMQIDPERAKLIQAYSKGMDIQSYYAAVKKFGGSIAADIHAYDPTFNASKMRSADKIFQDLGPSGSLGKVGRYGSTALGHLADLHDSIGITSMVGMNSNYKEYEPLAASELASLYANGNKPNEPEIKAQVSAFTGNPVTAAGATKAAARAVKTKLMADWDSIDDALPKGMARPGLITPDAAASYKKLTGEDLPAKLIKSGGWANQGAQPAQPTMLPGQRQGETQVVHNGQVVGFTMPGKNGMRPNTPPPQQ